MAIEEVTELIPSSIEGSADRGGWQASCVVHNNQDLVPYGRRAELSLLPEASGTWMDDYYLALHGSLLPESLNFNYKRSDLTVMLSTSHVFLENAGLQGIYFVDQAYVAGPTYNPHQIAGLNLGKIVQHIVEQHTNISIATAGGWVDTSGIDTTNSTTVDVYTVRENNSIWQALQRIADNEFYTRYFTKDDRLIYDVHPQFRSVIPLTTLNLTQTDIVGQPELRYRNDVKTDQVQLYALTDKGEILQSFYPANIGTDGRRQKLANLRCNSQARLDVLAPRAYKFLNRDVDFRVKIAGPWGAYLELYDRVSITYSGTSRNGVSIAWSNKNFWVSGIRVDRLGSRAAVSELTLEEEIL